MQYLRYGNYFQNVSRLPFRQSVCLAIACGGATIVAGTLVAGAVGAISSGAVTIDAGAALRLSTFNQTIGDLSGAGSIERRPDSRRASHPRRAVANPDD
jgi:hypothetical protein